MSAPIPALALSLALCAPPGRPLLSEVFYDAIGDDTGREFVEIYNPAAVARSLAGVRLEAGDGAGPGRWRLRWTGQAGDSVAPGARFVVGGALVQPPPAAVVVLDLQNGPDAVRLAWPDGAVEVVGYGAHEFAEYACGPPAPDVPAGQSLSRVPDDSDLGSNAVDFRAAPPSPGRPNRAERDVGWVPGTLLVDPEQPLPPGGARLAGAVANRGLTPLAAGEVEVRGGLEGRPLFAARLGQPLAPGDSARFEAYLGVLPEGRQALRCTLRLAGDGTPENDIDTLLLRVGPGPLEPTEIQFHPTRGEGEWVEVRNRGGVVLDLRSFTISDRGPGRGRPGGDGIPCEPESLAVLAQNRDALLRRYPRLDGRRVWQVRPWPTLNNTDDAGGVADAVVLRDADGVLCARQEYRAAGVPAGVPLERHADGSWWPALDPDGSPLAPPPAPPPLRGAFAIEPRRVSAGAGVARLEWSLPWPRGRVAVDVYDLAGARAGRAFAERPVAGRGRVEWRPDGLPPGLYVLAFRARPEGGGEAITATRVLRIDGAAP